MRGGRWPHVTASMIARVIAHRGACGVPLVVLGSFLCIPVSVFLFYDSIFFSLFGFLVNNLGIRDKIHKI